MVYGFGFEGMFAACVSYRLSGHEFVVEKIPKHLVKDSGFGLPCASPALEQQVLAGEKIAGDQHFPGLHGVLRRQVSVGGIRILS